MTIRPACVLVAALLLGTVACAPSRDLHEWKKSKTLWRGPDGTEFALFYLPSGLSADSEAYGCEGHIGNQRVRKFVPFPSKTFPMVIGDTAYVFDLENRATPGWYQLTRNHNLNWWQRNFYTDHSLGEWHVLEQGPIEAPRGTSANGGIFLLEGLNLRKVADEKSVNSLWDVPAEGVLYVGEPGIGVNGTIDLNGVCR